MGAAPVKAGWQVGLIPDLFREKPNRPSRMNRDIAGLRCAQHQPARSLGGRL